MWSKCWSSTAILSQIWLPRYILKWFIKNMIIYFWLRSWAKFKKNWSNYGFLESKKNLILVRPFSFDFWLCVSCRKKAASNKDARFFLKFGRIMAFQNLKIHLTLLSSINFAFWLYIADKKKAASSKDRVVPVRELDVPVHPRSGARVTSRAGVRSRETKASRKEGALAAQQQQRFAVLARLLALRSSLEQAHRCLREGENPENRFGKQVCWEILRNLSHRKLFCNLEQ